MAYTVTLIGAEGTSDKDIAATRMFKTLLERDLGDVEKAYDAWLAANNAASLNRSGELPSDMQLAVSRWVAAYAQARLIALAAYQGNGRYAWFDLHVGSI